MNVFRFNHKRRTHFTAGAGMVLFCTLVIVPSTAANAAQAQGASPGPKSSSAAVVAPDVKANITAAITADISHRNTLSVAPTAITSNSAVAISGFATAQRASALATEDRQLISQRDLYAKYNEVFTSVTSTITVKKLTVEGDSAIAETGELTTLTRTPVDGQPRPDYKYDFNETVSLVQSAGTWRVASATWPMSNDLPETVLPSAQVLAERADPAVMAKVDKAIRIGIPRDPAKVPDSLTQAQDPLTMHTDAYSVNPSVAVVYAYDYWDTYNTAYRSQPDDCTNFASQALHAAGWPEFVTGNYNDPSQWWYGDINQSYAWVNAQMLSDYGGHYTSRMYADVFAPQWRDGDIALRTCSHRSGAMATLRSGYGLVTQRRLTITRRS